MDSFIVKGGCKLHGEISVSGAKNSGLKFLAAACLTSDEVILHNLPLVSDFFVMIEILNELGAEVTLSGHTVRIKMSQFNTSKIFTERAAYIRTSSLFIAPLLARLGEATIPNPGGCNIGARPIDRVLSGLNCMGFQVRNDNPEFITVFRAAQNAEMQMKYRFNKNSHTGTETLLMAAILGKGNTILENAAQEPEVDELIHLLNKMGADIKRAADRTIVINAVERLHGAEHFVGFDRNETVSFASAAIATGGDVFIKGISHKGLECFLEALKSAGAGYEVKNNGIRFFSSGKLSATDITTAPHPGFMTDWQGPWATLMTKARGTSTLHETVYENRFGYAAELIKMGAKIELFNPLVNDPEIFYNFNLSDDKPEYRHALKITGGLPLNGCDLNITDLRAGATLVIAALTAEGESRITGIRHLDRGYEMFEERLKILGAQIRRERT